MKTIYLNVYEWEDGSYESHIYDFPRTAISDTGPRRVLLDRFPLEVSTAPHQWQVGDWFTWEEMYRYRIMKIYEDGTLDWFSPDFRRPAAGRDSWLQPLPDGDQHPRPCDPPEGWS